MCLSASLWAQNSQRVVGTVRDSQGEPIAGATVHISGTNKASITDVDGRYTIDIPGQCTLIFSFVGYDQQSHKVTRSNTLNITLHESDVTRMSEVVVTGYSKQERRDLTGAVTSVRLKEHKPFGSIDQLLAGQAPGVYMSTSSGALGAANVLTIRGVSSIMGDNNPLYVIDGVPVYGTDREANSTSTTGGSIAAATVGGAGVGGGSLMYNNELSSTFEKNPLLSLNPDDIESIEILKDAFATAIYGSRGATGVILITTKKGSKEKTAINVNYSLSIDNPLGKHDLLSGDEYCDIYSSYYPTESYRRGYNTDWQDAVTRTAVSNNVSASISGGTKGINYFVSMSYNDNESYIINNDLQRYSARANIDADLSKNWKMGVSMSLTKVDNNSLNASSIYANALAKAANLPIYNEDGSYYYGYGLNTKGKNAAYNPVAEAYINDASAKDTRVIANAYLEYKPFSWLSLRSEIGTDIYNSLTDVRKAELPETVTEVPNNQASESSNMNYKIVVNNLVNMSKVFNDDHFVQGVLGQSYEYSNEHENIVTGSNFFSPDLIGVGAAETTRVQSAYTRQSALFSAFARMNYQYKRRYMAGVTYRVDGSSRFNKDHRYLGTPSFSLGWRLSEEKFIQYNAPWIDELKLRGSVGWSSKDGNNSYYGAQATYKLADINYGGKNYLMMSQPGNRDLGWEKTITYDAGLDFTAFNNRLDVTVDYFYKKTTGMLFPSDVALYTGYVKQNQNIADMQNTGVEVKIMGTPVKTRDFTWQSTLNLSHNTNKILKLDFQGNQLDQANSSYKFYGVGYPIAQWYLHEWVGVDPLSGDPLWRYEDGTTGTTPPAAMPDGATKHKKICGNALPTVYGGFTNNFVYKDWELNFMFSFSFGGKMINSTRANLLTYSTQDANNLSKEMLSRWQIAGQKTEIPRLNNKSIINNQDYTAAITTTRFLEDNDFVRLKNIELAYNVPQRWLVKTRFFNRVRVYAAMTNVFTITGYSGLDPEVSAFGSSAVNAGYDNMTMPASRGYQFGARISF